MASKMMPCKRENSDARCTFTKRASVPFRYSSKLHNASYVRSVGFVNITGEGPPETVGEVEENGCPPTLKAPGELLK